MSLGLSAGARRTHPGAGKVLRKGRGVAGRGVIGRAKWYDTACVSLSVATLEAVRVAVSSDGERANKGGGVMGARARQESHMDYQPAIF